MVVANKLSHCESADLLRATPPDPQFWNNSRITGTPISSPPNQNKRTPVCFYCGITGHVIGVCKKRKRDQATNNSQSQLRHSRPPMKYKKSTRARKVKPDTINKIVAKTKSFVPYIEVSIHDFLTCALVDSGSVTSILSSKIFSKLNLKLTPSHMKCVSATEQPIKILGEFECKIKVDRYSWRHKFLVADKISAQLILGADFIKKTRLLIDLSQDQIFFSFDPQNKLPILESPSSVGHKPIQSLEDSDEKPVEESFDLSHLDSEKQRQVKDLIRRFPMVFTSNLGLTSELEYEIILEDNKPVRLPPYRMSPPKLKIMKQHIKQMLSDGIIRPSTSNYSSPIFLVPKGEKEFRPVIDYRVLNSKIHIDSTPLPDIHSCFHWFSKARYFTTLDLNSAYYQIPLSENCRKYTAFATDWNLYEFCRVPFGIAVGAQVLTRLLDKIFSDIKFNFVFNYLDDLVIYSETFEEHVEHLKEVLKRLQKAHLTVKLSKVKFVSRQLSFLGHIISPSGITIDQDRTLAIRNFPPPKDAKGIARFLGMVNYFHKFIPQLAETASPLNLLRRKGEKFAWGPGQQKAFEELKTSITNPPVLGIADFTRKFILQTDACGSAVAAVLLQDFPEGRKPIAYASRTLSKDERKYSIYELEALAVLFGIEKFRLYLEHSEFELHTDNQALSFVLARPRKSGRLARWAVRISAFKFKVTHIRSSQNLIADTLSRMFDGYPCEERPGDSKSHKIQIHNIMSQLPVAFESLPEFQRKDPSLADLVRRLSAGETVKPYALRNGLLCCNSSFDRKWKIVLPPELIAMVFKFYHVLPTGGHLGIYKTREKIRENFIWKSMDKDIQVRVKSCEDCLKSKPVLNKKVGFLASEPPKAPMDKIFIDFLGPLPRSRDGNTYMLVGVDAFSKFVWLTPVREATSNQVIKFLKNIFASFGVPRHLVSDNAQQFVSRSFHKFCFESGVHHFTTTPYYPNPSMAERVLRNVVSALKAYHHNSQNLWDTNLHWLQAALNMARHEAHKQTPFSILMAFKPNNPLSNLWSIKDLLPDKPEPNQIKEIWARAKRNLMRAHQRRKEVYNRDRTPVRCKIGDTVMYKNYTLSKATNQYSAKLAHRYKGPYTITKFVSPVSVLIKDQDGKTIRAHLSQLKMVD